MGGAQTELADYFMADPGEYVIMRIPEYYKNRDGSVFCGNDVRSHRQLAVLSVYIRNVSGRTGDVN